MRRSLFAVRGRSAEPSQDNVDAEPQGTGPTTDLGGLGDMRGPVNAENLRGLLYEALETEIGGIGIYEKAIECAQNEDLREEWRKYLEETRNHERILREVFRTLELDPETETPGRRIVRANADALVSAMDVALDEGEPAMAEVVAAECVVLAETKDHMNWELIGEVVKELDGEARTALKEAHDEVEDQEDEHLYHTRGWARELWLQNLGLPAVLPPPEEKRDVTTMADAARAQKARTSMLRGARGGAKRGRPSRASGRSSKGKPRRKATARRRR